jgi:outer membrane protein assembly factor BamB
LLWQCEGLGKGYSSVSIAGGKIFTMGDRKDADGKEQQFAMAFDLETRDELWATRVGPPHSDGPRCTPTWDDGVVYVLGTSGDLLALEADSGK